MEHRSVIVIICCLNIWSNCAFADSDRHIALEPPSGNGASTKEAAPKPRHKQSPILFDLTERQRPLAYYKSLVATTSSQLAASGNDVMALAIRGCCFWRLEKFESAETDMERAVNLAPHSCEPEVYRVLGECYVVDGELDKADASFTKAIELAPEQGINYLRRAQTNVANKNYSAALPDADHLVTMCKSVLWTLEFRAKLFRLAGHYAKAIEDCNAALKVQPNSAEIYSERSKAYDALGNHSLADADRKKSELLSRAEFKDLLGN